MMKITGKTLAELAQMVGGDLVGDPDIFIASLSDLAAAGDGRISFLVPES